MVKIGNTSFEPGAFRDYTFDDFKKQYAGLLDGCDISEAFRILTGRSHQPAKQKAKGGKAVKFDTKVAEI
jgi:hypothetical protein